MNKSSISPGLFDSRLFNIASDEIALRDETGNFFTYADLQLYCDDFAQMVPPRSLVLVLCENTIGLALGLVALINNKIVPMLVNSDTDKNKINALINNYKPDYIYRPKLSDSNIDESEIVFTGHGYILSLCINCNQSRRVNDSLCLLLSTSGSTGSSKFVRISYDNLKFNSSAIVSYLDISPKDVAITTLPLHYSYGLSVFTSHLLAGASIVITQYGIMQREFWTCFEKNRPSTLSGVPYTYAMLKKMRFFERKNEHLKVLTQAGGRISEDLNIEIVDYCNRYGKKFLVMYGMTEATSRMSYLPDEAKLTKLGSIGKGIPGAKLSLIDLHGCPIESTGCEGELVYEGRNVALGYSFNRSDLLKGDEWRGRIETGDLAVQDSDGYFYITGRKKRVVKIFGNRVSLDEIEREIIKIEPECAVVGSEDIITIYVTNDSSENLIKSSLTKLTKINRGVFKIKKIKKIPRTESGKISYSDLSSSETGNE